MPFDRGRAWGGLLVGSILLLGSSARAESLECDPLFPDCSEGSSWILDSDTGLSRGFCAKWNPDFAFTDGKCCGRAPRRHRVRGIRCAPERSKNSFCDEMTLEQTRYVRDVAEGRVADTLATLEGELLLGSGDNQSQCTPDTGFLVHGRPLLERPENGIIVRRPDRCVNFGTDRLVALLDWAGRRVTDQARTLGLQSRLLVGDLSAPRGGALCGKGGRKGHSSHKTGQDADLGFIRFVERDGTVPREFSQRHFDPGSEWWFLKELFSNPYVCVQVVFLDRTLISRLRKLAADDPEWPRLSRHIRHVRGHRNHLHVRVGDMPGGPGCSGQEADLTE